MKSVVSASAPGKIIITGEHFVVHGSYAVAAAINKRVKVSVKDSDRGTHIVSGNQKSELESNDGRFSAVKSIVNSVFEKYGSRKSIQISISSSIPRGSGLGSSAAVSVATAAALLKFLEAKTDFESISEIALSGERYVHGNPSGIDIAASIRGGVILFSKSEGVKPIQVRREIQFIVIFSGLSRKTSELITKVAKRRETYPFSFERLTQANSFLSLKVAEAISSGDIPELGTLMNVAQASLFWTGVSTSSTDILIEEALSNGSLGAKITGAGGGGSVIALPKTGMANSVLQSIFRKYPVAFLAPAPQEGLQWEN